MNKVFISHFQPHVMLIDCQDPKLMLSMLKIFKEFGWWMKMTLEKITFLMFKYWIVAGMFF